MAPLENYRTTEITEYGLVSLLKTRNEDMNNMVDVFLKYPHKDEIKDTLILLDGIIQMSLNLVPFGSVLGFKY